MGRRGPKPQPTALRLLRGNPGKRAVNHEEPVPPPGEDTDWACPAAFGDAARVEWERQVGILRDIGVLTLADRTIFEVYCQAVGDLGDAQKALDVLAKAGAHQAAAQVRDQVMKLRMQVKQLAAELGVTPSSRSGVRGAKVKPAGNAKLDRFFTRPHDKA
jgi:P27 family predicted phage terminase small subunit